MKFAQLSLLICLGCGALGCGQKGPLVMPDAQKHKRSVPSLPGAPAKPANGTGTPSPTPPAPAPTTPSTPPAADPAHP